MLIRAVVAKLQHPVVDVKLQHRAVMLAAEPSMFVDVTRAVKSHVAAHLWNSLARFNAKLAKSAAVVPLRAVAKLQRLAATLAVTQLLAVAVKSQLVTHAVPHAVIAVAVAKAVDC